MTEKDCSICLNCKHQDGTFIDDYEVTTWCKIDKTDDCDRTFECEYFEKE